MRELNFEIMMNNMFTELGRGIINISFPNYAYVPAYSTEVLDILPTGAAVYSTESIFVVKEISTGEFFRFCIDRPLSPYGIYEMIFKKAVSKGLLHEDDNHQIYRRIDTADSHIRILRTKDKILENFINENYDLSLLSKESEKELFKQISKRTKLKIEKIKEKLDNIIQSSISHSNEYFGEDIIQNIIDERYSHNLVDSLNKNKWYFNIKYELYKHSDYFCDSYSINKFKQGECFVELRLDMNRDYHVCRSYITENKKDVIKMIFRIIKNHYQTADYSSSLGLYSLILSKENVLIAKFRLKGGSK